MDLSILKLTASCDVCHARGRRRSLIPEQLVVLLAGPFSHTSTQYMDFVERTCEANAAGENSSFVFIACVKSVPFYHFKLAYVVLQMVVKEFFETHF